MKNKLKKDLTLYFEAPKPEKKREFIRKVKPARISMATMLWIQCCYISVWAWLCSAAFFGLMFLLSLYPEGKDLGLILAMTPFWGMVAMTESLRSWHCGMQELEMAARFSLKSVIFARLLILGLGNVILLFALAGANAVYLLTPYLLASAGGIVIVRRMHGKEANYMCFGFAALVALAAYILSWQCSGIFHMRYLSIWGLACVLFAGIFLWEAWKMIQGTEDMIWN